MKKLEITLPQSWNDLTLDQYIELRELEPDQGELEYSLSILSVLSGLGIEEIEELPWTTTQEMIASLDFLKTEPDLTPKPVKHITLGGKRYNVLKDLSDMTTSQFIDFQNFSGDLDQNCKEILACFIIPDNKKYGTGYKREDLIQELGKIKLEEGLGMLNFFLKKQVKLLSSSLRYLITTTQKEIQKETNPEKKKELQEKLNLLLTSGLVV